MPDALEITRRAKSNLAFALGILPREKRRDTVVFYAFCRTLDDLTDDPGIPMEQRGSGLDAWQAGLVAGFAQPTTLQQQVVEMRDRCGIPNHLLLEIIDGCRMDLQVRHFETWEDLSGYIWKVACAVGLVSIRLFGCVDPGSERYAVALGRALQLINILRDIREDFDNGGRIYLPLEDLARFAYTQDDLAQRVRDDRFLELMAFEAGRAEGFFREAAAALPVVDRRALAPARIMGEIYQKLLDGMMRDGFRVFDRRYRVGRCRKLAIFSRHLAARLCFR